MAFFERWWREQNPSIQQKVRQLVRQGRLELVGGGMTQNDEAVTHYSAILDNLSLGLKFIAETFGKVRYICVVLDWIVSPIFCVQEKKLYPKLDGNWIPSDIP